MKVIQYIFLSILLSVYHLEINAQEDTLLFETFNECILPEMWHIEVEGNQDALWYIGTPINPSSDSSSIDGTCMVIIDDDATGENTTGFTWTMKSPYFHMGEYSKVSFSADVHMRVYDVEQFTIYLEDESGRRIIQRFEERNYFGTQFSEYVTIMFDLVFFESSTARLVFEYQDNETWGWWAGFDNVLVTGEGYGEPLLLENFDSCSLPDGWNSYINSGEIPWQIGIVNNSNAGIENSLNGSCFLYFDDDQVGQEAPPSQVVIVSASFDGIEYASYELQFDLIFRTYSGNEYLEIGVKNSTGYHPVEIISSQIGGDRFDNYESLSIDISAFKDEEMHVYFRYDDGSSWNWWVGIDNIKVVGQGSVNDFCFKAIEVHEGLCTEFDMQMAYAASDVSFTCNEEPSATLWYLFDNPFSRVLEFSVEGGHFNDIIEIFEGGSCSQLELMACQNRDEYGFVGERLRIHLESGQYHIRISGNQAEFGKSRGTGCLFIREVENVILPAEHSRCEDAIQIGSNEACLQIHNNLASHSEVIPSRNNRARADVWLQFIPQENANWRIHTAADFSDMITVYTGNCQQLEEIQSNEQGLELLLKEVEIGRTYYIQWSGYYSNLEGEACIRIEKVDLEEIRGYCATALEIVEGHSSWLSNTGANTSTVAPSCDPLAVSDVWFKMTATQSGAIYVRNLSEFISTLAIYSGDCDSLQSIYCDRLNHGCNGFNRISGIVAGEDYYIQIAGRGRIPGENYGNARLEWVYEDSFVPYESIDIQSDAFCVSKNAAAVTLSAEGGTGIYFFESDALDQTLFSLEEYYAEVTDSDGCVDFMKGTMPDCSDAECNVFFDAIVNNPSCHDGNDGYIELIYTGGVGPYYYELNGVVGDSEIISNLAPGAYSLILSDAGGCNEDFAVTISNPALLEYEIIQVENSTGSDGVIHLDISGGVAPYEIIWFRDGMEIELEGMIISNLSPGSYLAHIYDSNSCMITSETIVVEVSTLVENQQEVSGLRIFPNPTENYLNILFKNNFSGIWNLSILDRLGRNVKNEDILMDISGAVQVDLQAMPPGIYYLRLSKDENIHLLRFVKI